jgi:hypothetical protein
MTRLIGVLAAGVFLAVGVSHAAPQGQPPFERGKLTRTVDGVRFSLYVPKTGWENGPHEKIGASKFRTHGLLISKSTLRGQAAEAVIFWAGFKGGGEATPCAKVLPSTAYRSRAELAAAVARAPGTKLAGGLGP